MQFILIWISPYSNMRINSIKKQRTPERHDMKSVELHRASCINKKCTGSDAPVTLTILWLVRWRNAATALLIYIKSLMNNAWLDGIRDGVSTSSAPQMRISLLLTKKWVLHLLPPTQSHFAIFGIPFLVFLSWEITSQRSVRMKFKIYISTRDIIKEEQLKWSPHYLMIYIL